MCWVADIKRWGGFKGVPEFAWARRWQWCREICLTESFCKVWQRGSQSCYHLLLSAFSEQHITLTQTHRHTHTNKHKHTLYPGKNHMFNGPQQAVTWNLHRSKHLQPCTVYSNCLFFQLLARSSRLALANLSNFLCAECEHVSVWRCNVPSQPWKLPHVWYVFSGAWRLKCSFFLSHQ